MSTVNINLQAKDLTASGGQGVVDPTPDTLVQRTSTGAIKAADATADNELTTKKQVDTGLAGKVNKITTPNYIYVTDAQGEQGGAPKAVNPVEWSIMQRGDGGRSQVNDPVADKDIANKEYVDNAIAAAVLTSPNGTKYKITVGDDGILSTTVIT